MTTEPRIIEHHLREVRDLCSYSIVGAGQTLGSLSGLIFDPQSWDVVYFLITRNGEPGSPITVPIRLFRSLDDTNRALEVGLAEEGLRSTKRYRPEMLERARLVDSSAVIGKTIDGLAGQIGDLLVNVDAWQLRYLVIETDSRRVLTDIEWCSSCNGGEESARIDLPAEAIATAPPYRALEEMCSGYEESLYRHYTRREYAVDSDVA